MREWGEGGNQALFTAVAQCQVFCYTMALARLLVACSFDADVATSVGTLDVRQLLRVDQLRLPSC